MVLSDFFVKEIPSEFFDSAVLAELSYARNNKKLSPRVASLREAYPKVVSTLRFQHGWANVVDAKVLFSDPSDFELLWQFYLDNGRDGIAAFFGIGLNTALTYLRCLGFYERSDERLQYLRDKSSGYNPFLEDSHLKYYLLGFILGDGCLECKTSYVLNGKRGSRSVRVSSADDVFHCSLALVLSSSDEAYLRKFESVFSNTYFSGPVKSNFCLSVKDRGICEWVLRWGIVPGKSHVGVSLPAIPDEFKHSFLLGLLDSDGWVSYGNNGRGLILGWCGHGSYMPSILGSLKDLAPHAQLKVRSDGLNLIYVRYQAEVVRLARAMYANAPFCLERKKQRIVDMYGEDF